MPKVWERNLPSSYLSIWKIDEAESELKSMLNPRPHEQIFLKGITALWRRKEWMASRIMASEYFGERKFVSYDQYGRPVLEDHAWRISISHSKKFVAIQLMEGDPPGIDIELSESRIHRIHHKFVNDFESAQFDLENALDLYRIWCSKEVAFKIYRKGSVDFRKHLFVSRGDGENMSVEIRKPTVQFSVPLMFKTFDDFVLCYRVQ